MAAMDYDEFSSLFEKGGPRDMFFEGVLEDFADVVIVEDGDTTFGRAYGSMVNLEKRGDVPAAKEMEEVICSDFSKRILYEHYVKTAGGDGLGSGSESTDPPTGTDDWTQWGEKILRDLNYGEGTKKRFLLTSIGESVDDLYTAFCNQFGQTLKKDVYTLVSRIRRDLKSKNLGFDIVNVEGHYILRRVDVKPAGSAVSEPNKKFHSVDFVKELMDLFGSGASDIVVEEDAIVIKFSGEVRMARVAPVELFVAPFLLEKHFGIKLTADELNKNLL